MLSSVEPSIQRMEYHPLPTLGIAEQWREKSAGEPFQGVDTAAPTPAEDKLVALRRRVSELESQADAEHAAMAMRLEDAKRQGREEGVAVSEAEQAAKVARERERVGAALVLFSEERDAYFAKVEQEVVRLALAIAARVLHREAQMDPLLLSGAVRVALGQLAESTEAVLRVPAAEAELWTEMVRLMPSLPLRPRVEAEASLTAAACILQTSLGEVDLGVRAQLQEIERGFFDLLEQRPPRTEAAR